MEGALADTLFFWFREFLVFLNLVFLSLVLMYHEAYLTSRHGDEADNFVCQAFKMGGTLFLVSLIPYLRAPTRSGQAK